MTGRRTKTGRHGKTLNNLPAQLLFRRSVKLADTRSVRTILESSNYFTNEEVKVGVDLVRERLEKGRACGYYFIFAELGGKVVGYSCYGPVPGTQCSFDLYWIAVSEHMRGRGVGKRVLKMTERSVCRMGGNLLWVETSSTDPYEPTRIFYRREGYRQEAILENFYGPGNHKIFFLKDFDGHDQLPP